MVKLFLALCLISTSAFAQKVDLDTKILSKAKIKNLIGNYPKPGSLASRADFAALLLIQKTRSNADCEQARADENTSVASIFGNILNGDEALRMQLFLLKAYANAGVNAYIAKSIYKRPRPYEANKDIKPCIGLERSSAYPSGHSMIARLNARILSRIYPERAGELMKRANEFAWNRVVGGVHHPTDVKAAFVLSDYLAIAMMADQNFVNEMNSLR